MREDGFATRWFGDDGLFEAVIHNEECADAARIVGFLIGSEEECGIACSILRRREQAGCCSLDIAGSEADSALLVDTQCERIGAPSWRIRDGVQMHVEHALRMAAHGKQRHRTGTVIGQVDLETWQLGTQGLEDAAAIDRARRIAGIERDQRFEMCEDVIQHDGSC